MEHGEDMTIEGCRLPMPLFTHLFLACFSEEINLQNLKYLMHQMDILNRKSCSLFAYIVSIHIGLVLEKQ